MDKSQNSIYIAFSQVDPNSTETMVLDSLPKAIGRSDYIQNYIKRNRNTDIFKKLVVFNFDKSEGGGYDIDSIQNKKDNIVFAHLGNTLINRVNSLDTKPFLDTSLLHNSVSDVSDVSVVSDVSIDRKTKDMLSQLTRDKIKNFASSHFDKWSQTN